MTRSLLAQNVVFAGVVASAALALAAPPHFYNTSPSTTIVDLNTGQTSFLVSGFVRDDDVNDTVDFLGAVGLAPFMTFEGTPGNPASFEIHAENLTGLQYGGYFVDVVAFDSETPFANATSYSFAIGIIPEPMSLVLTLFLPLSRRNRL